MNRYLSCLSALSLGLGFFMNEGRAAGTVPDHDLIPVPAEVVWAEGLLPLDGNFALGMAGVKDPRVVEAAGRWLSRLEKRTGLQFAAKAPVTGKTTLVLECRKAGAPVQSVREDESYSLTIGDKQATLSAANALGILRGLETLLQLVRLEAGKPVWPAVVVRDQPRFPWRGLLVDAARHWQPVEVIKRNLDGLAQAKMNVLHWHLSEDQGFRVECRKYPNLHGLGSDGNFYTQAQIREVVAYARARGIRVLPEFDVPGHATSWLVGYPELSAGPGPYAIERHFGIFNPTFDPSKEAVYAFLDAFIGEMAPLFPDEYFHIGGDEVTGRQWNQTPSVQAFMNKKGMKTNNDLQMYFNSRLSAILAKHGKKMAGWDEIAHPKLPKNILVQSWRGPDGLARSAADGYDVVLSNGYYLDQMSTAAAHYSVDPIPPASTLDAKARAHILGGEACMWGEYVTPETIDSRIWPRLLAVAERLWSPPEVRNMESLYKRMEIESGRLEEVGLTHRSNYRPMLERLVAKGGVEPLKVLADVVTPIKAYGRGSTRDYTSLIPLQFLVDAARPESETARRFVVSVDAWLASAPKFHADDSLRAAMQKWKGNHAALGKFLLESANAQDAFSQSQDLSEIARIGLEALDFLQMKQGKVASSAWSRGAAAVIGRAQVPHAEIDLAVLPAIRKLVIAASPPEEMKALAGPSEED